jgi:hypothetical protein
MRSSQLIPHFHEVYSRAIQSGLAVKHHFPATRRSGNFFYIGQVANESHALKNLSYEIIYNEIDQNDSYHIRLPDGGVLIFQYKLDATSDNLCKHRLSYFPSPNLPSFDDAPDLYDKDHLYGDIISERNVRFPIRFDYDPSAYRRRLHPHSHMSLGQYQNCRIPVTRAVSPNSFFLFITRNFYHKLYKYNMNILDKKIVACDALSSITDDERSLAHFVI